MERAKAEKIVGLIISDLTNRSGLEDEWEMIDDDIQQEIIETWVNIILET